MRRRLHVPSSGPLHLGALLKMVFRFEGARGRLADAALRVPSKSQLLILTCDWPGSILTAFPMRADAASRRFVTISKQAKMQKRPGALEAVMILC